jgi:ferric-dicitrate binding protein FerR (iron transport regulator)
MNPSRRRISLATALSLAVLVSMPLAARAAEVGTVAAASGAAEIGRQSSWTDARVGSPVQLGDQLRTGQPGAMRVVFQDDSVLNLANDSLVTVDEQVFDPAGGEARSTFQLLKGRVRALVSEYYDRTGAAYEIETPTAVSGVRGTEFIVTYDDEQALTQVIGISGKVEVHSILDRAANGVFVTAGEITQVAEGQYPTKPPRLDDNIFRQYLEGLQFAGLGRPEGLAASHPIVGGAEVPDPDRAPPVVTGPVAPNQESPTAAGLLDQPIRSTSGDLGVRF